MTEKADRKNKSDEDGAIAEDGETFGRVRIAMETESEGKEQEEERRKWS